MESDSGESHRESADRESGNEAKAESSGGHGRHSRTKGDADFYIITAQ